jgi:3-isopropylmalate/(R)-2-methylmalate dehydratase small subunit
MNRKPFTTLDAVAVPFVRPDVDTDIIMPSREMKHVSKTGLSEGLFAGLRYREMGGRDPNPDFVLNDPRYAGCQVLLGGNNFGCGSSREHAVWGLAEYGFRAIVAPSFNPIFYANCARNAVLPVVLSLDLIEPMAKSVAEDPQNRRIRIDLPLQCLEGPGDVRATFEIAHETKEMLLHGLDMIGLTLQRRGEIESFRAADRKERPWVYL